MEALNPGIALTDFGHHRSSTTYPVDNNASRASIEPNAHYFRLLNQQHVQYQNAPRASTPPLQAAEAISQPNQAHGASHEGCTHKRTPYGYPVHFCGHGCHTSQPFEKEKYCINKDIVDPVKHLPTCHCQCFRTELRRLHRICPGFLNQENLQLCHRSCYQTSLWHSTNPWADKGLTVVPLNRSLKERLRLDALEHSMVGRKFTKRKSA